MLSALFLFFDYKIEFNNRIVNEKYNDMKEESIIYGYVASCFQVVCLANQLHPGCIRKIEKETIAPMQVRSFDLKDVRLLLRSFS